MAQPGTSKTPRALEQQRTQDSQEAHHNLNVQPPGFIVGKPMMMMEEVPYSHMRDKRGVAKREEQPKP